MDFFSQIPGHNQVDIMKKMGFKDFIKFKQCSQHTVEMTKSFKHRLPVDVDFITFSLNGVSFEMADSSYDISELKLKYQNIREFEDKNVRFLARKVWIGKSYYNHVECERICSRMNIRAESMLVDRWINTEFDENGKYKFPLKNILKILQVKALDISCRLHIDDIPEINKLRKIKLIDSEQEECVLFLLKVPNIEIVERTPPMRCVNAMFKEWLSGERSIERLFLPVPKDFLYAVVFEDLEVTVHADSEIPQEVRKLHKSNFTIYSLHREDKKKLYISLGRWKKVSFRCDQQLAAGECENLEAFICSLSKKPAH